MNRWLGDPEAKGLLVLGLSLAGWQFGPQALAQAQKFAADFPIPAAVAQPEIAPLPIQSPSFQRFARQPGVQHCPEFMFWGEIPEQSGPVYLPQGEVAFDSCQR